MKLLILLAFAPALVHTCADGYHTWMDGRCFNYNFHSSVTYNSSFDLCTRDKARLPSIKSPEESEQFLAAMLQYNTLPWYSAWLGLTCDGEKFVWADGSEVVYNNFARQFDCNPSTTGRRYYVDNDRLWYESLDGNYFSVENVVCEAVERSASLCDDYSLVQYGKSEMCYRLKDIPKSWEVAEEKCREDGAHLSIIHDQTMNDFIRRSAVANDFGDAVHIGIHKNEAGKYVWADGSSIDYDNFFDGFPNDSFGNCTAMNTNPPGQWMNVDCSQAKPPLPYICTRPTFHATNPQPPGCPSKTQYVPGDEIFSPSYPQAPGVTACDYVLRVPDESMKVEIEITFLEANSCCDSLTIYDTLTGSFVLQMLTGYQPNPIVIRARTNAIRMQWNATSGANVRGFRAKMGSWKM